MIGTGNVTEKKSAPSFNKIEHSRLVAVANRNPQKAEDYAQRHGIDTWHKDPYEVIRNPEVDIVYIATPPGSHMDYALETFKAGKPVYIEKPMARTGEECRIINEAAEKAGLPVFVAYYRRGLEYFKKVKSIIDSGSLGKILHINMQQYYQARTEDYDRDNLPWRVIPEDAGGGYFHDLGCHALDILFHIFGNPLEVSGKIANVAGHVRARGQPLGLPGPSRKPAGDRELELCESSSIPKRPGGGHRRKRKAEFWHLQLQAHRS